MQKRIYRQSEVEELCRVFCKRLNDLGFVLECHGTAYLKKISSGVAYEIVGQTDLELIDIEFFTSNEIPLINEKKELDLN